MTQNTMTPQEISTEVLIEKYAKGDETTIQEVQARVAKALAAVEPENKETFEAEFLKAQENGFIPAGRINSAAGTGLSATLINCFVQPVGDSISRTEDGRPGIYVALQESAETQRLGGGVGYNFSHIRPKDAKVKGTGSNASGPISYMRVFDRSCETVSSAGSRRGAQLGALNVEHPDIEEFISAKKVAGELTNFNVSIGISDSFMKAVEGDLPFDLVHIKEPNEKLKQNGAHQREDGLWVYKTVKATDIWAQTMKATYDQAEPGVLFLDRSNRENNLHYVEKLETTNPCGEQILPDYGCCCLGSIDLTKFILKPFTDSVSMDWKTLTEVVQTSIRMLDNVLDATVWPLEEQRLEAMNKRRVGLGITGLGDALIMTRLAYDSEEARLMAGETMRIITHMAYLTSVELAKEKGAFPLFDADKYLESGFAKRLPDYIRGAIKKYGMRNSHLISIAPTGTISLAFADNASNGIEPAFSWSYTRTKRMPDGTKKDYVVEDHAYRLYKSLGGDVTNLPDYFRSALDISVDGHVLMVNAVKDYVDAAISKTINVPAEYPYEDFKQVYMQAWKLGLKGITTYRPSGVRGAVLSITPTETKPVEVKVVEGKEVDVPVIKLNDSDKRLVLTKALNPVLDSLRWPSRPALPRGTSAWISDSIEADGRSFVTVVADVEDKPFEVWVTGGMPPRGLGSTAKMLSLDMHTDDTTWAQRKLEILRKANGSDISMTDPATGEIVQMPSSVAVLARLVQYRYEELGHVKKRSKPSPMLEALIAPQEPKTTTDGTMGWIVDVLNVNTGDDFVLMLKELQLPDGSTRPYSVWAAGKYPKAFNGLLKILSLDMRIVDPAWIGMKLRKLMKYSESQGDFMAKVPGSPKMISFPSTEAYIAKLIIHRYAMLGILDENGFPLSEMGVVESEEKGKENKVLVEKKETSSGSECPECHNHTLIKKDGCNYCTSCGYIGSCG